VPGTALAFDPFEIQVYDGSADEKGHGGLEVHLNRHGEQTRVTFEPSYGITDLWEIGGYLQTAQGRYEGVKLRSKFVTPDDVVAHFRFGMNFELSREPSEWGGEVRPIAAYETERWLLVVNPIVSFPAAFEPCWMAKFKLQHVGFGVEYYSSLPGEHYVFEAADLIGYRNFELNLAFGQGLTDRSERLLVKMIVGYTF
jgi:hypothetical protein